MPSNTPLERKPNDQGPHQTQPAPARLDGSCCGRCTAAGAHSPTNSLGGDVVAGRTTRDGRHGIVGEHVHGLVDELDDILRRDAEDHLSAIGIEEERDAHGFSEERGGASSRILIALRHIIERKPTRPRRSQHIGSISVTIPLDVPVARPSLAAELLDKCLAVCLIDERIVGAGNSEIGAVVADPGRAALSPALPVGRVAASGCMPIQQ